MPTRSIPWPRIVAEGVAIVVSILLAFGIQAWWEGRQAHAEEQQALAGLAVDFRANVEQLDEVQAVHQRMEARRQLLLTLPDDQLASLAEAEADSLRNYVRSLWGRRTFNTQDGTLDALIASGRLDTLRDPVLRSRLTLWKSALDDAVEEARGMNAEAEHVIDAVTSVAGTRWGQNLMTPELLEEIRMDNEVRAHSNAKRVWASGYLIDLDALAVQARTILQLVEEGLQ